MNCNLQRSDSVLSHLVQGALFFFPIIHPLIRHGGGTIWVLLCLGGSAWVLWARRQSLPLWRNLARDERVLLLGLLLIPLGMSLSLINSDDWASVGSKFEKLLQVLFFPLAYLFLRGLMTDLARPFFWGVMVSAPVLMLVGIYEVFYEGKPRAEGGIYSIFYGDIAVYFLVILLSYKCAGLGQKNRWIIGFSIFSAVIAMFLSGTRGAWLALLMLLPVIVFLFRDAMPAWKWRRIGIGVLALLVVFFSIPNLVHDRLMDGVQNLKNLESSPHTSWGTRYHLWKLSISVWKEHPWIGTGLGDMNHEMRLAHELGEYPSGFHSNAHNIFFDAMATTGTIGLLVMVVGFFVIPLWFFARKYRLHHDPYFRFVALAGFLGIIAFALFGLTDGWLSNMAFVRGFLVHILVFSVTLVIFESSILSNSVKNNGIT